MKNNLIFLNYFINLFVRYFLIVGVLSYLCSIKALFSFAFMEAFHKALMSPMARATPPAAIAVVLLLSTLAKMDLSKISGLLTIFKFDLDAGKQC